MRRGWSVSFPSDAGRELRSLGLRAFGARRGRAVRAAAQPGPDNGRAPRRLPGTPDHGAVEGGGGLRQHRGMQDENRPIRTGGRSSIDRLPATLRGAVDQAIADGATIDDITARIRAGGGDCSRSAVGRYAKNVRDLIRQQQETDRTIKAWVDALGERPEGQAGLVMIETLRTMTLATMADLSGREEPVSTQELARLSLILKRIESTDKLRKDSERPAEKAKAEKAKPGAGEAKRQGGLSPETVAIVRAEVEGRATPPPGACGEVTSAPVDPSNPVSFPAVTVGPGESHLIPDNPGERWPEIAPGVYRTSPTSILSLGRARGAG